MPLKHLVYILLICLGLGACRNIFGDPEPEKKIVARAGNESLDLDAYTENYLSTGIIKDSAYHSKRSVERWATEALFYQEAVSELNAEEMNIEREVEAYRKQLVNHIYQTRLVEANLDTVISRQEIEEYYNDHRDNFILKENILKVNYFKFPLGTATLPKIRKLLGSTNPKDKEQLTNLCLQVAENFFMNDSTWLFLEDIKKEIPALREQPDFNLSMGRVVEFSDDQYYYYLKVRDVKVKNGLSPLNFEVQNIRKFIINMRKTQLINQYKKDLLEKARSDKRFVVY
jgi:hypothetical protein